MFTNDTHETKNVDINKQEDKKIELKNKIKKFMSKSL